MCNFLSAIVLRNGDAFMDPENTNSHEDLISIFKIKDNLGNLLRGDFCRVEFTPPVDKALWGDLSKWTLRCDEYTKPDWWDEDKIRETMEARVERMIVRDKREFLLGGCYILVNGANVNFVKNAHIFLMSGNARVGSTYYTSIDVMINDSSIDYLRDLSSVTKMLNKASIRSTSESTKIFEMFDESNVITSCHGVIGNMFDKSHVDTTFGYSRIHYITDYATVKGCYEWSHISWIGESATINCVDGHTVIESIGGLASIKSVIGNAIIYDVGSGVKIETLTGDAQVHSNWGKIKNITGNAKVKNDNSVKPTVLPVITDKKTKTTKKVPAKKKPTGVATKKTPSGKPTHRK